MPVKNPRVSVVIEPKLYDIIQEMSVKEGLSMSTFTRDLIREAIELREDIVLAQIAAKREKSFESKKALTHKEVWK
ncbi:MAG: antitoxin, RHH family protein [Deltaproteobacteria bacterium RBG_19FT_COMBO_43_11]|nr:MAG: antitoxin, RHH family protein [Deltaproteobacteria bacterium RBG_16_44_11]OGP90323.1 MAG: antitoxin, RHH family protein [Deltaproteobacteria bacterium RBG_19FT_COMBO_43_11]